MELAIYTIVVLLVNNFLFLVFLYYRGFKGIHERLDELDDMYHDIILEQGEIGADLEVFKNKITMFGKGKELINPISIKSAVYALYDYLNLDLYEDEEDNIETEY